MHAFGVEQVEKHIPIRAAKIHQFTQRLQFFGSERYLRTFATETQCIIEKHLMHFHHIAGQVIHEFAAVFGFGADYPQYELVLFHRFDVAVHPCGHATMHIRVASFQNQADSHAAPPVLRSICTVALVALSRYKLPVSLVRLPPRTLPGVPSFARNMSQP